MSEPTTADNFEHTLSCATVGYPEETGDACTCGADRAKAAWNAALDYAIKFVEAAKPEGANGILGIVRTNMQLMIDEFEEKKR